MACFLSTRIALKCGDIIVNAELNTGYFFNYGKLGQDVTLDTNCGKVKYIFI
jgi:hypothetical protein